MEKRKLQAIGDDMRIDYTDRINSMMDNPQWSSICVFCLREAIKNDEDPVYAICFCQTNPPRVAHESCIEFQEDLRIKNPGDKIFECVYCNTTSVFVRKITSKQPTETIDMVTRTFWSFFKIIAHGFFYSIYCKTIGRILIAFNEELEYGNKKNILTNQIETYLKRHNHYIVNSLVASLYKFSLGFLTTNYHTDTIAIEFIQISIVLLSGYLDYKLMLNFLMFFSVEIYCFILLGLLKRNIKTNTITINLKILNMDAFIRNKIINFNLGFLKTLFAVFIKNLIIEIHFSKIQWIGIFCFLFQLNCIVVMYLEEPLVVSLRNINISPTVQ